jgi:hypothetical protein
MIESRMSGRSVTLFQMQGKFEQTHMTYVCQLCVRCCEPCAVRSRGVRGILRTRPLVRTMGWRREVSYLISNAGEIRANAHDVSSLKMSSVTTRMTLSWRPPPGFSSNLASILFALVCQLCVRCCEPCAVQCRGNSSKRT